MQSLLSSPPHRQDGAQSQPGRSQRRDSAGGARGVGAHHSLTQPHQVTQTIGRDTCPSLSRNGHRFLVKQPLVKGTVA